jgi:hypothetical protein
MVPIRGDPTVLEEPLEADPCKCLFYGIPIHPVPEAADYWQSEPQGTRARPSESYVKPDGPPSQWTFEGHRSHEPKTSEPGNSESTGIAQIRLGGVAPNWNLAMFNSNREALYIIRI